MFDFVSDGKIDFSVPDTLWLNGLLQIAELFKVFLSETKSKKFDRDSFHKKGKIDSFQFNVNFCYKLKIDNV
jgi:hypothetical protein